MATDLICLYVFRIVATVKMIMIKLMTDGSVMTLMRPLHPPSLLAEATFVFVLANCNFSSFNSVSRSVGQSYLLILRVSASPILPKCLVGLPH